MVPVSYTHLDVYKRQEIDNEDIKIIDDIPYCGGQCADPDEVDF